MSARKSTTESNSTARRTGSVSVRKPAVRPGPRTAPPIARKYQRTGYTPPVLMRRAGTVNMADAAHERRKSRYARARRRLDMPISSVPGAEVRLPALPSIHLGWRLLSGLMVLGLLAALYYVWTSPAFRIPEPQVTGMQRVSPADINMVIGVVDEPIFTVVPGDIEALLLSTFPDITALTATVTLPNSLAIELVERQPVLTWTMGDRVRWVDADGWAYPPRGEAPGLVAVKGDYPLEVPETQNEAIKIVDSEMVQAIQLLDGIRPKKARVLYDPERGLGWNDPRGWKVYFGFDIKNINVKIEMYQLILKRINSEGLSPQYISVENIDSPYIRVEQ